MTRIEHRFDVTANIWRGTRAGVLLSYSGLFEKL
jgi:hypothetical protein